MRRWIYLVLLNLICLGEVVLLVLHVVILYIAVQAIENGYFLRVHYTTSCFTFKFIVYSFILDRLLLEVSWVLLSIVIKSVLLRLLLMSVRHLTLLHLSDIHSFIGWESPHHHALLEHLLMLLHGSLHAGHGPLRLHMLLLVLKLLQVKLL